MSREPENVSMWAKNAVYVFRQGGPTLISLLCMGAVAWQAMTQVRAAVDALTMSVERNAVVMSKFMEAVSTDHRAQLESLKQVQSQLRARQSSAVKESAATIGDVR